MTASLEVVHYLKPRNGAVRLFECRDPEVLISGPAGTGKSRIALQKVHMAALKYPGMRALLVRKTLVSLTSTSLVTFREKVAAEALANRQVTFRGNSMQEPAQFVYAPRPGDPRRSVVVIGGMDKATKIMSSEYDLIFVEEATELELNDWESLTTRLRWGRMPYQQIIGATNPGADQHWLKQRTDQGVTTMIESRHEDNPTYFDDAGVMTPAGHSYIEGALDKLTGVRYSRYRQGLWVSAEGVIWDGYDPAIHLVDRYPIPLDWPRRWSVDFGVNNPTVVQRWAESPDGQLIRYAETYRTHMLAGDVARHVLAQAVKFREPMPVTIVTDHDAQARGEFERALGHSTVPANKSVGEGIEMVAQRLKLGADGKPRLVLMRDSLDSLGPDPDLVEKVKPWCTEQEITSYVWAPPKQIGGPPKEEPVKKDDHGCDAMRYLVAEVDNGFTPRIRFM